MPKKTKPQITEETLDFVLQHYYYLQILKGKKSSGLDGLNGIMEDFTFSPKAINELQSMISIWCDYLAWNPKYPYLVREEKSLEMHVQKSLKIYPISDDIAKAIGELIKKAVRKQILIFEQKCIAETVEEKIDEIYKEDMPKIHKLMYGGPITI